MKNNKNTLLIALCISALGFMLPHCSVALANMSKTRATMAQRTATNRFAEQLDWIVSNDPRNLCHGYFAEPILDASGQPILPLKESATSITADSGLFSQKSKSILTGDVVVIQPGRRLEADHAVIYRDASGRYKILDLTGNVRAYQPGELIIADSAHFNLLNKTGVLQNVKYRTMLSSKDQIQNQMTPVSKNQEKLNGAVAWGQAQQAIQTKPEHTSYKEVSYSTCSPDAVQWKMVASKMNLNKKTEYGNAENVRFYYKGIPIFYVPYWTFPLTKKRKTGLLFPLYGETGISGFQIGVPFYWNIAPNYDDTITPTYYSKRGVLYVNKFRYLTHHSLGAISGSFMPDDSAFKKFKETAASNYAGQSGLNNLLKDSDNRYSLRWQNETQFNPHWTGLVNYAKVSDDYYLQDFGSMPEQITTNEVLQQGQVQYNSTHWVFTALVQGYQTLHPVNRQPLANAYDMLPQFSLDANYPDFWKGLDFSWQNQATYFSRQPVPNTLNINGGRFETRPGLSYPMNWIWGYFTPQVQYDVTKYQLGFQNVPIMPVQFPPPVSVSPLNSNITRKLPIFDVHSGLYFDRNVHIAGQSYDQTLEPELFYLYVPYVNQDEIPEFDSGMIPFDYSQLWATNRFSGLDRIGDANQMTYAVTTRFINNKTGNEKFRFSVGQIYYFHEHRVQLCDAPGNPTNCSDFLTGLGAAPDNERVSPIAALTRYHIDPAWSLSGGYAWDPTFDKSITGSAYVTYSPRTNAIVNFGYSYLRNGNTINTVPAGSSQDNLNQVGVSTVWPINNRWSGLGIFNYNISQDHPQTYLGGFQYNTCCVDFRVLGGRMFSALNQVGNFEMQNAFYFQIALKGLGVVGDNSLSDLLTSNIGGYVDPFQTTNYGLR